MRGTGKVFVIAAALVLGAGSLIMVEAAMPDPLVHGARRVAHATESAVHNVADFIGGLFGRDASLVAANAGERQVRAQDQARQGDEFTWSGALDVGDVIEIKGVNGSVIAEPTSGSRVEVRAVKKARVICGLLKAPRCF